MARRFGYALGMLAVVGAGASLVAAQEHDHSRAAKSTASGFIKIVRESTERFKDVAVARHEDYELAFGCVSGPDYGAMGMHFVNFPLVLDGVLDPTRPEIVIYEPLPNGRLRLIGADYLVLADAWHATNTNPPELGGQLMHLLRSAEPLRPAALLHAACVGLEGEPHRRVRELARERVVRGVQRSESLDGVGFRREHRRPVTRFKRACSIRRRVTRARERVTLVLSSMTRVSSPVSRARRMNWKSDCRSMTSPSTLVRAQTTREGRNAQESQNHSTSSHPSSPARSRYVDLPSCRSTSK